MIDLLSIKDSVQQVANAIATVFKLDVEVINLQYYRVAGTGKYARDLGKKIKHYHVYERVINNQLDVLITNPKEHQFCSPCTEKDKCQECGELCAPIKLNDTVIGVFGLIAFNEEQRRILLSHHADLMSFIKQMGEMIAAKVSEQQFIKQLQITKEQLETIINSVNEGILAINNQGLITHCNYSGAQLLNLNKDAIINKRIDVALPESKLIEVITTGSGYKNQEIHYKSLNKMFLSTACPIISHDSIVGAVASFITIEEVKQLIWDYSEQHINIPISTIIGNSKAMEELRQSTQKFAISNSTVLIRGESGTGKELVARALHSLSPRKDKPFIALNCSAIPDSLLESELFGYEEGAFTGAKRRGKPGKFEIADGGTIFLDEIGDMPIHLQAKILRTIQERTVERVGGNNSISVDIRIIAATNRPLESMIYQGEFREDLYYRLNVLPLNISPLRQRKEDIVPLLEFFTIKYNKLFKKTIKGFSKQAVDLIMAFDWPGNIRELENAVEYAFNVESTAYILEESLPSKLRESRANGGSSSNKTLAEIEKETIKSLLGKFGFSLEGKKQTAEVLDIGIATLYRKIKQYQLE